MRICLVQNVVQGQKTLRSPGSGVELPQKCSHAAPDSNHSLQRSGPYKTTQTHQFVGRTTSCQKNLQRKTVLFFVLLSYLIKENITVNIITACKYTRMTQAAEAESSSTTGVNNTEVNSGKTVFNQDRIFFPTTETLDSANVFRTELSIWNISI